MTKEYLDTRASGKRKPYQRVESVSCGVTGQRARAPPEPIPNSEVKPRSVFGVSVVFGHVKPEKLVPHFKTQMEGKYSTFITLLICKIQKK